MESLIMETRELKNCLRAGYYERAYELAQNIDDELTTMELKKNLPRATKHRDKFQKEKTNKNI